MSEWRFSSARSLAKWEQVCWCVPGGGGYKYRSLHAGGAVSKTVFLKTQALLSECNRSIVEPLRRCSHFGVWLTLEGLLLTIVSLLSAVVALTSSSVVAIRSVPDEVVSDCSFVVFCAVWCGRCDLQWDAGDPVRQAGECFAQCRRGSPMQRLPRCNDASVLGWLGGPCAFEGTHEFSSFVTDLKLWESGTTWLECCDCEMRSVFFEEWQSLQHFILQTVSAHQWSRQLPFERKWLQISRLQFQFFSIFCFCGHCLVMKLFLVILKTEMWDKFLAV